MTLTVVACEDGRVGLACDGHAWTIGARCALAAAEKLAAGAPRVEIVGADGCAIVLTGFDAASIATLKRMAHTAALYLPEAGHA